MRRAKDFADYLWMLLPSGLKTIGKKLSGWWVLCRVLGRRFDGVKAAALDLREAVLLPACPEELLPVFGLERGMPRLTGETAERYRRRLTTKRVLAEQAGTAAGLVSLMRAFGYPDARVEPLYLTDPARWAEATLWIESPVLAVSGFSMLQEEVDRIKPASALIHLDVEARLEGEVYWGVCMETSKIVDMEEE